MDKKILIIIGIAIIFTSIFFGIMNWKTQFPRIRISNRVTSIIDGYQYTQSIMKTLEKDAYLNCIIVDIVLLNGRPEIENIHYLFISRKKNRRHFWVKIDNSNYLVSLAASSGEGLNVVEIEKFDKYIHSPIDIGNVTIDITEALKMAQS